MSILNILLIFQVNLSKERKMSRNKGQKLVTGNHGVNV